jgi:uncharacterized protein (DUF58 family)
VTRRASPRLEAYAVLAAIGLVASLALRRPELAALSAPFALLLTVGLQVAREPKLEVDFTVAGERTLEGADVDAEIVVRADTSRARGATPSQCDCAEARSGRFHFGSAARGGGSTTSGGSRLAPVTRFASSSGSRASSACGS